MRRWWTRKVEREVDEELNYHLERYTQDLIRGGMSPDEARHSALRAFGGVEQSKEQIHDTRGTRWVEELIQDLIYAVRVFRKRPAFSLIAIATLALGIGANTTIFSIVNALFLQPPLGINNPEELVTVTWDSTGLGPSYPDYLEYRNNTSTLAGIATYSTVILHMGTGTSAQRLQGALVSGNYFTLLQAVPHKGRVLTPEDDTATGANPVAVISDGLASRLGNSDRLVGSTIRLNALNYTIVGVASSGFGGVEIGHKNDIWIPLSMAGSSDPTVVTSRETRVARGWLKCFARIKQGATIAEAQTELSGIARSLAESHPETNKGVGIRIISGIGLGPGPGTEAANFTRLLAAVAGLVLLIACANVANLLLARGQERRKEIGMRLALGAARFRIIRQLLTESVLLGIIGGAAGAALAFWIGQPIRTFVSSSGIDFSTLDVRPDARIFGVTLLVSILTGVVFGIFPALEASRAEISNVVRAQVRRFNMVPLTLKDVLVTVQVALSLILLIAAGLLVRTLQRAQSVKPGFNPEKVLMARIDAGRQGYSESQGRPFYEQIVDRVETLPGVRAASMAYVVPLKDPPWRTRILPANLPVESESLPVNYNVISPGYFATMGIPLIAGRDFDRASLSQQNSGELGVAILNESLSRRLFPDQNPIGQKLIRFSGGKPKYRVEVVGIVRDSKYLEVTETPAFQLYLPSSHQYRPAMALLIRTENNPAELIQSVRHEVQALDGSMPIFETRALSEIVYESLAPRRSAVTLIGVFGFLGLILASLGLHGVMAYLVSQSTREIGIRMALGAQRSEILAQVLKRGAVLVGSGLALGITGSFLLSGLIRKFLFDVSTLDWVTFLTVPVVLAVAGLLAALMPARRASSVDPIIALRCE